MCSGDLARRSEGINEIHAGPTGGDIGAVRAVLRTNLRQHPPAIGVVGVSGVGKSSVINAMFKTELAVGHSRAQTRHFQATTMTMRALRGPARDEPISLVIVDAPGLGEDHRLDSSYLHAYERRLPGCDVILWMMAARNRATSLDQRYLALLGAFHPRIVFAVNQVDLVHPMDWNATINLPSPAMERYIDDMIHDRIEKIGEVLGRRPDIVPVSASKGYNLEKLFGRLVASAPPDRRFVFDALKNFSYRDFVPTEARPWL
jgi:uncharacterized protein